MTKTLPYDSRSPESILAYARKLLGKSLHDLYPTAEIPNGGKGGLGQCVEEIHFGYHINSVSKPDFADAGVELKCTPLKAVRDGSLVSKERLVLNIINYCEECDATFETSSFTRKNALLLLMFYLYLKGVGNLDLVFKLIRLWKIPEEDLKIFMDDWKVIHEKIARGLAHEISEADTFYLAACVKGARGGANKRKQKNSDVLADQRAYSIKSVYLNHVILDSLVHPEMVDGLKVSASVRKQLQARMAKLGNIVKSSRDYKAGESFEQLVLRRFEPFIGQSVAEIENRLGVCVSTSPKAVSYSLCRAILGVKERGIAEFEKAGVLLKTVRLESNGSLKEAMSFQTVKYKEIVNEEAWEDSDWYATVGVRRFFFVVFRKMKNGTAKDAVLEKVFFWAMPRRDVDALKTFWSDTREKVMAGDYEHFMASTAHPIGHIRPKAKNAADMADTPQGGMAKKYCWWLNRDYVLNVVRGFLV